MNDVQKALGHVLTDLARVLNAKLACAVLYDPVTHQLAVQEPAVGLRHEIVPNLRFSVDGGGLAPKVFRSGQPYLNNDVSRDPDLLPVEEPASLRNSIIVPLDVENRRIGVLCVWNKRLGMFDVRELDLVQALASMLAVQIDKTQKLESDI